MNNNQQNPTLHFFRATPSALLDNPPLASSLQSLETTFFLLSMERYPSALVSCVSAWESVIKAKLQIGSDDGRPVAKLLGEIRALSKPLMAFDRTKLDQLRQTRNRIVHYGFSPHDDRDCCRLLLETGLPFLNSLYIELFGFYLNWRDVRVDLTDFMQLSTKEAACVGLVPSFADQLHTINAMYNLNRDCDDFDVLYCFTAFNHFLRGIIKESNSSLVDDMVNERAASIGLKHEIEEEQKKEITKSIGGTTWEFDCPLCNSTRSIVSGLDEEALDKKEIKLSWGLCVSCQLAMPKQAYHLADLVLQKELKEQAQTILNNIS
jgi:hypothetical protein